MDSCGQTESNHLKGQRVEIERLFSTSPTIIPISPDDCSMLRLCVVMVAQDLIKYHIELARRELRIENSKWVSWELPLSHFHFLIVVVVLLQ